MPPEPEKSAKKTLKIWVAVMLGALVFIMAARTPLDTDFWWHIRAGEETVLSGVPMLTDTLTFTRFGQTWINHSWLGEVMYYLAFRGAGFLGVGLLMALLATVSMLLVHSQLEGPELLKAAVVVLASTVAALVWSPRPQLFSLVLFAAINLILYLYKFRRKDRLWLLPILFVLWSNLHAGYSLGFLLLGAVIAGELFNLVVNQQSEDRLHWRELRKVIIWTAVCVVVVLVNPNGLETWWIPYKTVEVSLPAVIEEWASPDFHQFALHPFLWLFFAVAAAVGLSGRKIDGVDLVGFLGFAYLSFFAKRSFAYFAIFAAPVLARHVTIIIQNWWKSRMPSTGRADFIQRLNEHYGSQSISKNLQKAINLSLAGILFIAGIVKLYIVTYPAFVENAIAAYYPVGAVEYIEQERLSGRIFNSYGWGGYLEWTIRDSLFYIDGRTDLFGNELTSEWIETIQAEPGWENTLQKWEIQYCLIEPDRPLASALEQAGTKVLYEDRVSVLFRLGTD